MAYKLKQRKLLPFAFIALFASIGAYFIFQSKAADTSFQLVTTNISTQGSTATMDVYLQNIPSGGPYYVSVHAFIEGTQGSHPYFLECTLSNCKLVQEQGGSGAYSGADACITLAPGASQRALGKFKIQLVSANAYQLKAEARVFSSAGCPGLEMPVAYSNIEIYDVRNGAAPTLADCRSYIGASASGSACPGLSIAPPVQTTSGGTTSRTSKNGGSSGSIATKQSTQQSTLPSSGGQDTQQQPKLEPSPFIDGDKTYQPGSDPDTLGSSVSRGAKKFFSGWYLVPTILVLASGAGVGYWWFYRRSK